MTRLLKVIGTTENGTMVAGQFAYGKIEHGKTTYYVLNSDGNIIPCVKCVDDTVNN